jgi:hypothetical protein
MGHESATDSRLRDRIRPLLKSSSLGTVRARMFAEAPALEVGQSFESKD